MPAAKTALKTVGKHALRTGVGLAKDALSGEDMSAAVNRRGRALAGNLVQEVDDRIDDQEEEEPIQRQPVRRARRKPRKQTGRGIGTMLVKRQAGKVINRTTIPRKTVKKEPDYFNF